MTTTTALHSQATDAGAPEPPKSYHRKKIRPHIYLEHLESFEALGRDKGGVCSWSTIAKA